MKNNFIRVSKRIISGIAAALMLAVPIYSAFYVNDKVTASEQSDVAEDSKYQIPVNVTLDYEKAFALAKKVEDENKTMDRELLGLAMGKIVDDFQNFVTMTEVEILEKIAEAGVKSYGIGAVTYNSETTYVVITSEDEATEEATEQTNESKEVSFEYMANEFEIELDKTSLTMTEGDEAGVAMSIKDNAVKPDYYESEDTEVATAEVVGNNVLIKAVKKGETKIKIGLLGKDGKKKFAVVDVDVKKKEILPTPDPEPGRPNEKAEQGPLMFDNAMSMKVGNEMILKVKGGNGEGKVSYEVKNITGMAVVLGDTIKATKAGTISVIATKAADGIFKEAKTMMTLMIEATTTADVNAPVQTFINKLQKKHSAGAIVKSDASGEGVNATDESMNSAGEKTDAENHISALEEDTENVAVEEKDDSWMVWLWFLIPIITLMVMVILFARNRLR